MIQEVWTLLNERASFFLGLCGEHLAISLIAIIIAVLIGGALGIFMSEYQKSARLVMPIVNFLYTIPSISMLGFLIPLSGIGNLTAVIALTLYALLPMVRSTYTGLTTVNAGIIEAAEGMGSTGRQILWKIKLPLAMPIILSGIRNMVVMTLALAGIASFIGAGGLGVAIYRGITTNNAAMTVTGSLLIGFVALAVLFACSYVLSGAVTRPVARAWQQQKQFLSDASHELKTPLTVVLSSAELLDQSALPEQKQYVDNIRAESHRMKRLVEDMLTLSRVERSGAHLPDAAADLSDIAADAALRFEPVAFEAGHTLSYDIAPDLTVRGDGEKLAQAVAVLLDNAIKYAAPHTEIRLDALRQGRNVCVQVENRGADIPADKLPHIFDRFYRADESRTGGDSFGLGLPIAKAIAEAHHGAIRCDSSGGITRFTITLPCQQGK